MERKVCMHGKCMNMWHAREIASWAQLNPILPAHKLFNMYNTQLNAWKYNYNAYEMQCMRFLRSNLQNPSQKFHKNLNNFEKPQNFQKPQTLGFKTWNAWKWKKLEAYQVKKVLRKLEKHLGRGLEWEKMKREVKN